MKSSLLALVACVALLAGCAPKQPTADVQENASAAMAAANEGMVAAAPTGLQVVQGVVGRTETLPVIGPAPAWKLEDLEGRLVSSDDFKGKVVVLDFWATWCPPCRAEIPGYVDLSRKYGGDRLAIIGVSVDQAGPDVVKDFVKKFGVTYPVVMADDAIVSAFGGIEAIPTTFLIDRDGRIRDKKVGAEDTAAYEKKIAALLP